MSLELQIQSIAFSIFFGLFTSLTFNLLYPFLFKTKKVLKVIITLIYVLLNVSLYFYFLFLINYGNIHNYFLISLIIGFLIGNRKTKKLKNKFDPYIK